MQKGRKKEKKYGDCVRSILMFFKLNTFLFSTLALKKGCSV